MPPAARVTDAVLHPLPPLLQPGPGSPNVLIGFLPAWRGVPAAVAAALQAAKKVSDTTIQVAQAATLAAAGTPGAPAAKAAEETAKATAAASMGSTITSSAAGADIHACATPFPLPPHGPGVVIDGCPTVMINNLPACFLGNTILEPIGPPNKIAMGCPTVIICSGGGAGAPATPPPVPAPPPPVVTVEIVLSAGVACPCHPLEITAKGTPSGGTFEWSMSGAGPHTELVDAAGAPTKTGATIFLRSFEPDNANGSIPAQTVKVDVTYTHPSGTATDSENVTVHKIDFVVTNTAINAGVTQANETAGSVTLGAAPGVATMSTDPSVTIQLDASCPRKGDCAANHQVGWLQTVLTNDRRSRYTHTLITVTPNIMPIRDQINGPAPFYEGVTPFAGDNDTQIVHHEDSPSQGASWLDPRAGAPAPPPPINRQLRQMFFSNGFHAWLVVQDIEWAAHDLDNSFVFLRNFAWSMELNVTVDTTQPVGSRCTPGSNAPTIGALGTGKGPVNPVLTAPFPNRDHTVTTSAAPGI